MPGLLMKLPLQISCRQDNTVPSSAVSAETRTTPAVPSGAQPSSSARDQTTCTGLPGAASASSAASMLWLCDQICSSSCSASATAHDGATEPCAMNGR